VILHNRLGLLVALVTILASPRPARAGFIDFESLALDEIVTNQFASDGVLFGNAVNLVAFVSLNEIDFPPSSGTNVISGLGSGPLTADLIADVSHVSFQITTANIARVRYFDASAVLLGEVLVDPNLGGHTLVSFDSPGISSVSIGSQATSSAVFLTVDDFGFSGSVPEPSTLVLMMCGGLPLAAAFRRRRMPRH
jgi:hypothetical protein